ncbi:class I SAM-dependent methyltransferase [Geobacter sp. FeAm09]|uniref:class I SAM-dependent methyltransferase n=1 Tax=Geobacter sp. FeAm09 TaxID=2597769 RepID=UPI0011F059CD|nr:class I SAM-dependent methyltransferase [Geobacter sp. FeAm09]QEM67133.1 class I SAM-dependent methyltransferase [Geobacter sp. FeAm09]
MCAAAESVRRYSRFFKTQRAVKVLDYGTGTMRNACYLSERGFTVYAADLPEQVAKLRSRPAARQVKRLLATDELSGSRLGVDLVLSTYVFNIIMAEEERHAYLQTAVANLKPGGYLMMEVRCRRPDEVCGHSCDARLSPGTCAKTLSHGELDLMLAPHGMRRVSHYYRSHALAAIYRRDGTPPG